MYIIIYTKMIFIFPDKNKVPAIARPGACAANKHLDENGRKTQKTTGEAVAMRVDYKRRRRYGVYDPPA